VPESRSRKKATFTPPPAAAEKKPSPRWLAPTMLTLMLLGLAWIVVTYATGAQAPIPGIDNGNLAIGFGLLLAGFALTTRWR